MFTKECKGMSRSFGPAPDAIDLDRYPFETLEGAAARDLIRDCRRQLARISHPNHGLRGAVPPTG